jgi:hypothetical protein
MRKSNLGKNQTLLTFKKRMDGDQSTSPSPLGYVKYDADHARRLLCRYLILCELLFSHVEHEGFKEYSIGLEPRMRVPSHITMQRDCLKLYEEEKTLSKALLHNKRVCLTTDTWTSIQNLNYMCITAHFIDCDWKLCSTLTLLNERRKWKSPIATKHYYLILDIIRNYKSSSGIFFIYKTTLAKHIRADNKNFYIKQIFT